MARQAQPVIKPNLGLYYGQSPLTIPARALQDGRNFRIRQGRVGNRNLGWEPFFVYRNDANQKSLLHFDGPGADGSQLSPFDVGAGRTANKVWTVTGNAQLDTAVKKFGFGSFLFDGVGDWISTPDHADLTMGSGPWTVEAQVQPAANGTLLRVSGQSSDLNSAANTAWAIQRTNGNLIQLGLSNGSTITFFTGTTQVVTGSMWHIEATRQGDTVRLFINGALEATGTFSGAVNDVATPVFVGDAGDNGAPWNGWIDEWGFSNVARHVSTFGPPLSAYFRSMADPVSLIDTFFIRGASEVQIFGTTKNLYRFDDLADRLFYINPIYSTATVDVSAATPAVVTANTGAPLWITNAIKPGDEISFHNASQTDPEALWYTIASVGAESTITLTTAVAGAPFTNIAYTIRRTFTGTLQDIWDSETFVLPTDGVGNDLWFATNGVNSIVSWDGIAGSAIRRNSLGFTAKSMIVYKNMMIYGGIVTNGGVSKPTSFINSDVGKPLDVVNGLAGEFRAHDGVDHIQEMEDLGDNLVIYSDRHITPVQFVGDPLVFVLRQASTGIGPLSPRLLADFGDYHEFIGADSQYLFDGVAVTEVGKQVWREVLRQRDATRQRLGFSHFDEENGDLIWAIPLTSDPGIGNPQSPPMEAFVEHYLEEVGDRVPDPHSRRAMPFVCGGYATTTEILRWSEMTEPWVNFSIKWNESFLSSAFPLNLMGGNDGQVYIINVAQFGNGVAQPSFVRFGRRALGDGRMRGLLKRIYAFMAQLPGLVTVRTYYADHAEGPATITQTDSMDTTLPEGKHFVTPYRRGRYFELELRRDDGNAWESGGYDVDATEGGRR